MNAPLTKSGQTRMQRAEGNGRVGVRQRLGRTELSDLYQRGQAKIRLPDIHDGSHVEAVLINVSGGMTGGDTFNWQADVQDNATLSVTTQACEKIYRASQGIAESIATLNVGKGAALAWLPQEAILFDGSAYRRSITANVDPKGRLLLVEAAILGRTAMGESVTQMQLEDQWRIHVGSMLVHAEATRVAGNPALCASGPARLKSETSEGMIAFASLVLVAPDAGRFLTAVQNLPACNGAEWGVSHVPIGATLAERHAFQGGKLVARFAARDGLTLRRVLIPVIETLARHALDIDGLPKVWRL
jgi:urease accessory protein